MFLASNLENTELSVCYLHPQTKLIDIPDEAVGQVEAHLQRVLERPAAEKLLIEGGVLHNNREAAIERHP